LKLDERSEKCIFVVYSLQSKAYRLYNPISGKVIISRNVVFNEDVSWNFNSRNLRSNLQLLSTEEKPAAADPTPRNLPSAPTTTAALDESCDEPIQQEKRNQIPDILTM